MLNAMKTDAFLRSKYVVDVLVKCSAVIWYFIVVTQNYVFGLCFSFFSFLNIDSVRQHSWPSNPQELLED